MSEAAKADSVLSAGDEVGHYRLVRRIGEGGMGVVYEAEDLRLRRPVALKLLHPKVAEDPKRRRRFLREGKLAAQLSHPCIAAVHEVGQADGRLYIAMELVRGTLLSSKIDGALPVSEALRIVREAARGLAKAHAIGVVHRDLKPDNLMIGEDGIVKILDFGVAKAVEGSQVDFTDVRTHVGSLVGTPAYMSPEQAAGKDTDARSDIFSLGAVLYELLTGKKPFSGDTWQETIIAIHRDTPEPIARLRPELPPEIDRLVARCMAKKPDERYGDCSALARDLDAIVARLSAPGGTRSALVTADTTLAPESAPALRSRRLFGIALGAALLALLAALGLSLSSRRAPETASEAPAPSEPLPIEQPIEPSTSAAASSAATPEVSVAPVPPVPSTPVPSAPLPPRRVAPPRPLPPPPSAPAVRPENPVLGF